MGSLVRRLVVRRVSRWRLRGRRRSVRRERTEGDGCVRGVAMCRGFGEVMGLRFWVDVVLIVCDGGPGARGR